MKFREKWRLLTSLLADEDDEDDLDVNELLEDTDLLSSMMDELKGFSPGAGEVLIDERDTYIAARLSGSVPNDACWRCWVPASHRCIKKLDYDSGSIDSSGLDVLPAPSLVRRTLPWAFPLVMIGVLAACFQPRPTSIG